MGSRKRGGEQNRGAGREGREIDITPIQWVIPQMPGFPYDVEGRDPSLATPAASQSAPEQEAELRARMQTQTQALCLGCRCL